MAAKRIICFQLKILIQTAFFLYDRNIIFFKTVKFCSMFFLIYLPSRLVGAVEYTDSISVEG